MLCPATDSPRLTALVGVVAALSIGCGGDDRRSVDDAEDPRVAAVIKGVENPFFATMRDGLVASARQHGTSLSLDTAAGLQDTAGQASALESLVAEREDCYVVNPITSTNLIGPLSHLPEGTPIVNIDSVVDRKAARAVAVEITTYIGTDDVAAGRMAAGAMARVLPDGARVAIVTGIPGDVGSAARAHGFRSGARDRLAVVQAIAADFDRDRARQAAAEVMRSDARIRGFFAVNDEMALGVVDAVAAAGRDGEVAVVGIDGTREAFDAVRRGTLTATVAQFPYVIGQLGVEACLVALAGKRLPAQIDAPAQVVTSENVELALARSPRPSMPFHDPLAGLLAE